jgi:histidyl-tRNA synthetase
VVNVPDVSASTSNPDDYLSSEEVRSFLTLLAFQLVQTEGNHSVVVQKLVYVINHYNTVVSPSSLRLSRLSIEETTNFMQQWVPELLTFTRVIQRCYYLSLVALHVYKAAQLSSSVALPIAALSVDINGLASSAAAATSKQPQFTELAFDTLRPHRSMVTAAATLRAILNESRYVSNTSSTGTEMDDHQVQALCDIPQYHGPATEQFMQTCKELELEMNSRSVNVVDVSLDLSILYIASQRAITALQIQYSKCLLRQGKIVKENENDVNAETTLHQNSSLLSKLVNSWEEALSMEAYAAVKHIHEITATSAASVKEATTDVGGTRPVAAVSTTDGKNNNDDEFAGKSEAAIAKILKIRKEKEEKAAAKRKAKEEKGTKSLFGTGTQILCQVMFPYINEETQTISLLRSSLVEASNNDVSEIDTKKQQHQLVSQVSIAIEKLLSGGLQRKPKIPKGTRDYLPDQMMIRQQAFSIIRRVFESHGAVEIDTPVFELKDTLTGKYGEDSKLIYDLADQGGELLALRYDLTVPFARFLALNNVGNIKRFHIGKVYRRDQPALKRGRYREFYQCDFDIAGTYGRMVPDSECLCVVCDILHALPIGDFGIKLNHRCLLDAILDICGVPADKFRTICSAVDKLDKEPWSEVKREMVEDKGLQDHVADKIGEFVLKKGPPLELYKELMEGQYFGNHPGAAQAMEDLRILFEYLEAFDKLKYMSFDLSLARGLDYYTGVIYEAVCMSGTTQVGSIGGGGRYDNLVSMFQESGKQTPCVGVSVGIERVFTLMEARMREEHEGAIQQPHVSVLIASAGGAMMKEKMNIARILWDASISAEFSHQENAKLKKEVVHALDRGIPYMVVIGESELAENKVQVKDIKANTAELVAIPDLVSSLRKMGAIPVGCEFAYELLKKEGTNGTAEME